MAAKNGGLNSVNFITLLCEVCEVIKTVYVKTDDDDETVKSEILLTDTEKTLTTYCEGGHVQTYIDLEKLLTEISIIAPDLYMKFVTSKIMRDHT